MLYATLFHLIDGHFGVHVRIAVNLATTALYVLITLLKWIFSFGSNLGELKIFIEGLFKTCLALINRNLFRCRMFNDGLVQATHRLFFYIVVLGHYTYMHVKVQSFYLGLRV